MIVTILVLILILGVLVFVHELGHFIAAKMIGVYVHEFAIGMGPKLFSFKRKNKTKIFKSILSTILILHLINNNRCKR